MHVWATIELRPLLASFPGLHERSQAWAPLGLLGPQKSLPNPDARPQLIFRVATLLTAPPADDIGGAG